MYVGRDLGGLAWRAISYQILRYQKNYSESAVSSSRACQTREPNDQFVTRSKRPIFLLPVLLPAELGPAELRPAEVRFSDARRVEARRVEARRVEWQPKALMR